MLTNKRALSGQALYTLDMDKVKQRVWDVVSFKKNIGVLQIKIQVLREEVAHVQTLLMSGNDDMKDEVRNWFAEADEIIKEVSGIQDGGNNMADNKQFCSTCWDPTSLWEIGDMLRDIDKCLEERQGLDLSSYYCGPSYCNRLQSRKKVLHELLEALLDFHINMIGIYGIVGVGKTILAKELARHAQNNQLFDVIVMVQVSESVDVKHIQCQIANKIGLQLSEADDEETRAHFLCNALEEKVMDSKILLILDGIWCLIDLERVGIPHERDERTSCKVVLISRNVDVCKEMGAEKQFLLECLILDEAKILFRERLGDKIENMEIALERYQYMENVCLIKCRGLPLVINSLACALRSMSWSMWESVANEMERQTLIEVNAVKEVASAILELCSKFIQNQQKRELFLLCCLIQQGGDVSLAKLMRYGIGLSLFEVDSSEVDSFSSVVGQINLWVHELKSLSLITEGKELQNFKMHDIIRDVAIFALSQGDYVLPVLLDACTCWDTRGSYENCVAVSMTPDSNYKCLSGLELYKLEAFLLKSTSSIIHSRKSPLSLPDFFFQGMQNLRILEISGMKFEDFPSSIKDLKNLVTLHLEYCDIRCGLKSMISNLTRVLQVFSLRGSTFRALPREIGKLINLRVLDLTECQLHDFHVGAVGKLDQLRELYLYCTYWKWSTSDIEKLMCIPLEVLEIKIPDTCQLPPSALNFLNHLRRFNILYADRFYKAPSYQDFTSFSCVLMINDFEFDDPCMEESGFGNLLPRTEFLQIEEFSGDRMKCIFRVSKSRHNFFQKLRVLRVKGLSELYSYVLPVQLAATLRIVEVTNCKSLVYVFPTSDINETDGVDSSVELPCLEKLVLKDLKSLLALQDVVEVSITKDEALLFNEKVNLPSLREMHLEHLEKIVHLWGVELLELQSGTYNKTPCFGNLKYMTITHCSKLKSLFPSSTVISLLQLEKLEVHSCGDMEEVITSTHVEDDPNLTIMLTFPKLQKLKLICLSRLQCFCRGHLLLKFPVLRELDLVGLEEMKAFTLPNTQSLQTEGTTTLFDEKIEFPSVEQLRVYKMNIEFFQRREETTIFPNLLSLQLRCLRNLKALPHINSKALRLLDLGSIKSSIFMHAHTSCMSVLMSWELEELRLSDLDYVEDLLGDEKSDYAKTFFSLRKLDLRLLQVKNFAWNRLTNLRSLTICGGLEGWTTLMSSTLLVGGGVLPLLESLTVEYCKSLEAIISKELLEDQDLVKYGITLFPCLRSMEFYGLQRLESFSMGSYEAHFPSLITLEIRECHSLQLFSMGPLRTPRLESVEVDGWTRKANIFHDLNATLAELCQAAAEAKEAKRAEEARRALQLSGPAETKSSEAGKGKAIRGQSEQISKVFSVGVQSLSVPVEKLRSVVEGLVGLHKQES